MRELRNPFIDIMVYFSTPDRPVLQDEMLKFWLSCKPGEWLYYKNAAFVELCGRREIVGTIDDPCCDAWKFVEGCSKHSPRNTKMQGIHSNLVFYDEWGDV